MIRVRRPLLWLLGTFALLVLVLAGVAFRSYTVRRARGDYRPIGTLVDVGGRRLHVLCIGQGSPAVIFEPPSMGGARSASVAREALSRRTRVCSYDRMGSGSSDPGPQAVSAGMLADDLERMVIAAKIPPPYVLVPSSIGGLEAELFARRHPDQVVGMVMLDAASSDGLARLTASIGSVSQAALTNLACALKLIELHPVFCSLLRGADQTLRDMAAAPPLRADLPLIVLSAESTDNHGLFGLGSFFVSMVGGRIEAHQAFAKRSSRGQWRLVPGSDHLIYSSQPQAVIDAVTELTTFVVAKP
jgi:pimeloyl-ACP methyl ester carboxylesterase